MARRRKETLVEVLMHLPWQAGIIVGLLGFGFFRWGLAWYFNSIENPYMKAFGAGIANGALEPVAWLFLGIGMLGGALSVWRAKDRGDRAGWSRWRHRSAIEERWRHHAGPVQAMA